MYKTVRHGENSLQYTILPQHDDAAGGNGPQKTASTGLCHGRQHRTKRGGRTTTILVVTLLLVCSIVAGTILVPLLLTTDIMAFHKLQQSTSTGSQHIIHHHAPKVAPHRVEMLPTSSTTTPPPPPPPPTTTTATTTIVTTPEENLNTLTTGIVEDVVNSSKIYAEVNISDADVAQPLTTDRVELATVDLAKKNDSEEVVDNNGTYISMRGSTRVVVEEATPKNMMYADDDERVVVAQAAGPTVDPYRGWLPPRWPFADPSTYLQWTGYHDSLLLPLLLGILVVVLLIAGILYCVRRRYLKRARRAAIGKMSSDLQSDESADKTSLLPEFNSEEE